MWKSPFYKSSQVVVRAASAVLSPLRWRRRCISRSCSQYNWVSLDLPWNSSLSSHLVMVSSFGAPRFWIIRKQYIQYDEPKVNSLKYFRVGKKWTVPGKLLLYAVSGSFILAKRFAFWAFSKYRVWKSPDWEIAPYPCLSGWFSKLPCPHAPIHLPLLREVALSSRMWSDG